MTRPETPSFLAVWRRITLEWCVQTHRMIWFPAHWLLGLDRCPTEYDSIDVRTDKEKEEED